VSASAGKSLCNHYTALSFSNVQRDLRCLVASLAAKRLAPAGKVVTTGTPESTKKAVPATPAASVSKTPTPTSEEKSEPKPSEKKIADKKEDTKRASEKKDSVKTEGK
jgi:outer membrane biosynthesis protein TonB